MGNEKVDKKMDGEKNYQKKVKGTEKTLVRNGWARRSRYGAGWIGQVRLGPERLGKA